MEGRDTNTNVTTKHILRSTTTSYYL